MNNKRKILIIVFIGLLTFTFSKYFYQLGFVNGISMEPTLKNRQLIIIKNTNANIKKNDIVIIKKKNKTIIKRIIGMPGDKLEIKDTYLYVNNSKYDNNKIIDSGNLKNTIKLNEDKYFVLGDNRDSSIDSRYDEIGLIKKDEIKGIVLRK